MATMEELAGPGELADFLKGLNEAELLAQQIVQRGAMHALTSLLERGCTQAVARGMLVSLEENMGVIEAIAREKGFARLFAGADGSDA